MSDRKRVSRQSSQTLLEPATGRKLAPQRVHDLAHVRDMVRASRKA